MCIRDSPYGDYNNAVISAVKANGYLAARTVDNDLTHPQFTLASPLLYELPTLIVRGVPGYGNPATPPSYIKNAINNTLRTKGLLIITFHIIDDDSECCVAKKNAPEEYKISDFKTISDFLKSKEDAGQLDVVTMSEYFGSVTALPPGRPNITSFAPQSPVNNNEGAITTFNITVNQTVNVTWYINGTYVSNNSNTKTANYTNTSAKPGIWNVSALASNSNGSVRQTWIWNVTALPPGRPNITSFAPQSPVNNNEGAITTFNITVNQTANVTWYINGTYVSNNSNTKTANYTNTSAKPGIWNVSALASNSNGSVRQTWIWNVTALPSGRPNITSFAPQSPVNNNEGAITTFNITVNQTVNVTWYINGTYVSNNSNTKTANYTNTSAKPGIWNVSALASNSNGSVRQTWIWNVTALPPGRPNITSFAPQSPVNNNEGAITTFNITVNQTANVTWYINGTYVSNNSNTKTANYTNTSAKPGIWNVSALASNSNGSVRQTWIWNVTALPSGRPNITSFAPQSPVNNNEGAITTFNITVNQTVNVTWYINDTYVSNNSNTKTANYTNTSAKPGIWNVSALASNSNGSVRQTWIWNVTALPPGRPNITSFAPQSPVNNNEGAITTFNITVNQTVNVTWYINDTYVSNNSNTKTANYTNTSAKPGIWNVLSLI